MLKLMHVRLCVCLYYSYVSKLVWKREQLNNKMYFQGKQRDSLSFIVLYLIAFVGFDSSANAAFKKKKTEIIWQDECGQGECAW